MLFFNTKKHTWSKVEVPNQSPVKKRCGHVSSIMGGMLLVHGGKNSFQKLVLSEFNVYDFVERDWVPISLSYGKVTRLHQFTDEEGSNVKTTYKELGPRFFHSMTAVYDKAFYESKVKQSSLIGNRSMWVTEQESSSSRTCPEGFYIFGGVDD